MSKTKQAILLVSIIIIAFIIYGRYYAFVYGQILGDDWYKDFLKGYNEAEKEQKEADLKPKKDCPAIQHLHSGLCVNNADGLPHGSSIKPNRSSTLDCASNLEMCKMEGLEK